MAKTPAERVNLPVFRGRDGTFETWELVVLEPRSRRSTSLRFSVVARPEAAPLATVTVQTTVPGATPEIRFARTVVPPSRLDFGPTGRFHVRFGDAEIGHGFCRGVAGEGSAATRFNLRFTTQRAPSERTPTLLRHLPLPMRREHPHTEVRIDGWLEAAGERTDVRFALGAQLHEYGERRFEEARWLYAPELAGDENAALELLQTRIERKVLGLPAPAFASLFLRTEQEDLELSELRDGWMHRVDSMATGSIHARSISANRAVVVHAHAPESRLTSHRVDDPDASPRFVARSTAADVTVEIYERPSRFGRFRPKQQLVARGTAVLELLGPEPSPGVVYAEPDQVVLPDGPRRPSERAHVVPPTEGRFEPHPEVLAIYAASLSYRSNTEEAAPDEDPDRPILLRKSHRTWSALGDEVPMPDSDTIVQSLLAIEPELSKVLGSRFGFLPALLDYEVELGVLVLDEIRIERLEDPSFSPRLGWFVANDLTARVCQLFDDGGDARPFWELGKSFAGFCPVSDRVYVPTRAPLDAWPNVPLRTMVNGQVRQQANAREIRHTPRELLRACARARGGVLEPGVALLTGTPTGVAFRVSAWRKFLEDRLLDRFGRLEAAFGLYLESPDFLRPGDRVVVDGGFLGSRSIVIGSGGVS